MQRLISFAFVALMGGLVLGAKAEAQNTPLGALETTVLEQIEALKVRDYDAAFEFASEGIRSHFGSPENFAYMLENGYEMVFDPAEVEFLDNRPDGRSVWQKVMVTAQDGDVFLLEYQLIPDSSGWKINAVIRLQDFSHSV